MKVRIRKAGPGETPGYKNSKLAKFMPKAENGMEVENMEMTLVQAVYKAMMTGKVEPQKLYQSLLEQGVEPPMALRVIKKASMFAQEGEQENAQVEQAQQVTEEQDAATQRALEEAAAKQAQWEKLKMSNDNLNEEGAEQDEEDYQEDLQQQQEYQDEDDAEDEEQFNNMLFDDGTIPQQKYGGLTRAQFGYDVVNQRGNQNEAPSLTQDELIEQVFKMYQGKENMIPNELDRLIAKTPGAQDINFPGIEKYIPNYAPIFLSEGNSPREGIDLPEPMMAKRGGISKKQYIKQLHKFFAEGGEEDSNAEKDPEAEKETREATPLDTINGDVAKRKDGFLKALSFEAKEKVFNDFMANAAPEIQNVDFMKGAKPNGQMEQQAPMAQNGYAVPDSNYMVPENDFTHYTHGADDIFNQQLNEYTGQLGGFIDASKPDLNKFIYGGPDYMDKNTADPYSKDDFPVYGKYGVSVGNIKMSRGGPGGKNPDEYPADEENENEDLKLDPPRIGETNSQWLLRVTGNPGYYQNNDVWNGTEFVKSGSGSGSTDPYDIITDEKINYKYVPGGSGRVGLMNALLPWNPFRTVQRYSYDIPYGNLEQMENLKLGPEQYPKFNIRNLDNIGMRGGKKLIKKLGKEIEKLQKGLTQEDETHNIPFNKQVRDYFGDDKKTWRELGPQGRRASRNEYRRAMEWEAGKDIPKDEPEYNDMNEGTLSYEPEDVQRFDLGGQNFQDRFGGCPPGSKKDPISGLCKDSTGNTVTPTFISDATKNFDEFSQNLNDQYTNPYKYTTDMFTGEKKEKEGLFTNPYTDELNMNQPKFDYTPPKFNKPKQSGKLNVTGKLVTTDWTSGVNKFNAGTKGILGLGSANKKAENEMRADNANIMNLASRTVRQDKLDHQDLGSGYGGFRTYGSEQLARGAWGKEGGTFKRGGSQMEYAEGDELYMTEAEIADFIKNGGKLEFV